MIKIGFAAESEDLIGNAKEKLKSNEKGTQIHETITSCLATWKQQGFNPYHQIITKVS